MTQPAAASTPVDKRAVFAGCTRNSASHLPAALANLERLAGLFGEAHMLIVENDSTDGTRAILDAWGAGRPNYLGLRLDGLAQLEPVRTRRLELARNSYLQLILGDATLAAADYLVVMDLDDASALPIDAAAVRRALEFLDGRATAAAVFANQQGVYYDMWALRHPQKCPGDVWEEVCDHAGAHRVDDLQAFAATFGRRIFSLSEDDPPLAVDSAFGGLGIYKMPFVVRNPNPYLGYKVKPLRQDGGIRFARWQTCEHVHFHRGLRGLGAELYVLPWLINRQTGDLSFPPSAWRRMLF